MGSKASALPTRDGQGQTLSSKRGGFDNKSTRGINALPPACLRVLPKESFSEVRSKRGPGNVHVKHVCPHGCCCTAKLTAHNHTSCTKEKRLGAERSGVISISFLDVGEAESMPSRNPR